MGAREIPLIAFDGYYPRFMGEVGVGQRTKQKPRRAKAMQGFSFKSGGDA